MKVYVAGSISSNPLYKEQFSNKAKELVTRGYTVLNPVKPLGFSYKNYVDMGLCELMQCDAIYLMNGWEDSEGAKLEKHYAETVGLKVVYEYEEAMKESEKLS